MKFNKSFGRDGRRGDNGQASESNHVRQCKYCITQYGFTKFLRTVAVTTIMTIVVAGKVVAGVEDEAEAMIEIVVAIVAVDPVDETDLIELRSHWL